MVLVVVLVGINIWLLVSAEVGPDPEVEALHSAEAADRLCRDAVASRFADWLSMGPGKAEYFGGGEYEIVMDVELGNGRQTREEVVACQAQFNADTGWKVEDVALD